MTSKSTRSLMSRVSVELYSKVLKLADAANKSASDFVATELQRLFKAPVSDSNFVAQKRELELCKNDFVYFAETYCMSGVNLARNYLPDNQPASLYKWQADVSKDLLKNDVNVIVKSRQVGMTTLLVMYTLWYALFHDNACCVFVTLNHALSERALTLLNNIACELPSWMCRVRYHGYMLKFLQNGSELHVRSFGRTGDNFRGTACDLLLVDEAAWMKSFDSVLLSSVRKGGKSIISSTFNDNVSDPYTTIETKFSCVGDAFNRFLLSDRCVPIVVPCTDCPETFTKEKIAELRKSMPRGRFMHEYMCDYMNAYLVEDEIKIDMSNVQSFNVFEGTKPLPAAEMLDEVLPLQRVRKCPDSKIKFMLPDGTIKNYVQLEALPESVCRFINKCFLATLAGEDKYSKQLLIEEAKNLYDDVRNYVEQETTLEEILETFSEFSGGGITMNANDYQTLLHVQAGRFYPETNINVIKTGYMGIFDEKLYVYISRNIPVGKFFVGRLTVDENVDSKMLRSYKTRKDNAVWVVELEDVGYPTYLMKPNSMFSHGYTSSICEAIHFDSRESAQAAVTHDMGKVRIIEHMFC